MKTSKKNKLSLKPLYAIGIVAVLMISAILYRYTTQLDVIMDETAPSELSFQLSDDDKQVIKSIKEIENVVIKILGDEDLNKVNQATMAFIRKDRYGYKMAGVSKYIWSRYAGNLNRETGLSIKTDQETMTKAEGIVDELKEFTNPIDNSAIDFIHMVTVIDLELTEVSDTTYEDEYYDYLFSWGGDLETFLFDIGRFGINNNTKSYEDFYRYAKETLGTDVKSNFSKEDLIADIDGVNISTMIKEEPQLLSAAVENYYTTEKMTKRFNLFVDSFGSKDMFVDKVDNMMSETIELQYVGNKSFEEFYESFVGLKQLMSMFSNKSEIELTEEIRKAGINAFKEIIIEQYKPGIN